MKATLNPKSMRSPVVRPIPVASSHTQSPTACKPQCHQLLAAPSRLARQHSQHQSWARSHGQLLPDQAVACWAQPYACLHCRQLLLLAGARPADMLTSVQTVNVNGREEVFERHANSAVMTARTCTVCALHFLSMCGKGTGVFVKRSAECISLA